MVFNDGIVGTPSAGFIEWPDDYSHSSDDDLWQIDPTQLKRNAFIIAASVADFAERDPAMADAVAQARQRASASCVGGWTANIGPSRVQPHQGWHRTPPNGPMPRGVASGLREPPR